MKKFIFALIMSFFSLSSYAIPAPPSSDDKPIDIKALQVYKLNSLSDNQAVFSVYSEGAWSSGICDFIIRSNHGNEAFAKFTERFNITHRVLTDDYTEFKPVVTYAALIFHLLVRDYSYERVQISTKDGKSISENIKALFGNTPIGVMLGTCKTQLS